MSLHQELAGAALRMAGDDSPIRGVQALGGGMISQALRVRSERATYMLKIGGQGLADSFTAEARGLMLLAQPGAIRIPAVLACRDARGAEPGFLLLEWIEAAPGAGGRRAFEQLGAQLAQLHRSSAPAYGLDHDNYIGRLPQANGWLPGWCAFFRERRLAPQLQLAQINGYLDGARSQRAQHLLGRLDDLLGGHAPEPALLHGDLWSGNVLAGADGRPALIDPAVYYGDREADIAFTTLFGGFPEAFYRAYSEAWPLPDGWQERCDLYNLYHLLNHLNHFGESYGGAVDRALRRYVG